MLSRAMVVILATVFLISAVHGQYAPSKSSALTDALGDPLPEGAIARLGTLRFKHTPALDPTIDVAMFSPDGSKIVSLVYGGANLRLWDAASGKEITGPWSAPNERNTAVAFSTDGKLLAVGTMGSPNGPAKGKGGKVKGKSEEAQSGVVLYDIAAGKVATRLQTTVPAPRAIVFTDDGKTLVTAGDGTVAWWDIASGKEQRKWKPFTDETQPSKAGGLKSKTFFNCAISPDGASIAIQVGWRGENKGPVQEPGEQTEQEAIGYNLASGKITWRTTAKVVQNGRNQLRFAFSADSKRLAVAMGTDKVDLRDPLTGKLVATPLEAKGLGGNFLGGLTLSSDGGMAALAGGDSQVVVWDTEKGAAPRKFTARIAQYWNASTQCLHFSPDNKTLLVGADADIQLYDVATLQEINGSEGHRGWIDFLTFSADGARLLTGSADINMHTQESAVWDTTTWKRLQVVSLKTPPWPNVGIVSPSLTSYVGKGGDDRTTLYDLANGKLMAKFTVPGNQPGQGRGFFSPAGKHFVVSAKDDGSKAVERLYAVPSGKALGVLPPLANAQRAMESARPIAFSMDERLVASVAQDDGMIHVFETATGKLRHRLGMKVEQAERGKREENAHNLAFAHDGKLLASWSVMEKVIRIWDLVSGKEILQFAPDESDTKTPGNRNRVHFAFSPDSRVLAVGQGRIRLWELASLGVRRELAGHADGPVRDLAYAPDGRVLASGSADTTVLIWDAVDSAAPHSLASGELENQWRELAGQDAAKAYAAVRALVAAPAESVAWIKDHTQPAKAVDARRLEELLAQLDDNQFKIRQAAMAELVRVGEQAVPAIDKVMAGQPALETFLRLQDIRKRVSGMVLSGPRLQAARALEVLERIATPEARQVLQSLADGASGALVTAQARQALARLK